LVADEPMAGETNRRSGVDVRAVATKVAAVVLWLAVWQLASVLVGSKLLLASPLDTVVRLGQLLVTPTFLTTIWFSLVRIMGGFLVAYASAVVLAAAAHVWPVVGRLFAPAVRALKTVPLACVIVLLLMWVGSRHVSGPAVFLAVFPAVYFSCAEGLRNVDAKFSELLRVFRVRRSVCFLAHVWPSVLPYLVGTSKNVCGMAWKSGVAAELIGSPMGSIGERIYQAKILLETADLFAWTVIIVAISYACEQGFLWLLQATGPLSVRLSVPSAPAGTISSKAVTPADITLVDVVLGHEGTPLGTDVHLSLGRGERGVLADESGAGKTTLLHTVAGLLPPLSGSAAVPRPLSMVFQETRLVEALSAEENVRLVGAGSLSPDQVRELLLEILPEEALSRPVRELSGGQRRRVEIARAMAHPSSVVLLDEPFSSLDEENHRVAAAFVIQHLAGRTLLVASHAPEDSMLLEAQLIDALR